MSLLPLILAETLLLAFPGAEGYGRFAEGGRGGAVYEVTHLKDSGEGSFRAALEAEEPRTVVFRVAGNITLKEPIEVHDPYLTIAGQTAPGDGVCVRGNGVYFRTDHVIVRHMRFRPGDLSGEQPDAVSASGGHDLIFDHCSFSWGVDEVLSVYNNERTTVQWCLVSESLYDSTHEDGEHGMGGIWGGHQASFHHNLLAHHHYRNPQLAPMPDKVGLIDFRNNVIYNWGALAIYGGEKGRLQVVNNYFRPGAATLQKMRRVLVEIRDPKSRWYVAGNRHHGSEELTEANWKGVRCRDFGAERVRAKHPFAEVGGLRTESAKEAYLSVLDRVGATLPKRDAVDRRVVEDTRTGRAKGGKVWMEGNKGIIDSQKQVGGWPNLAGGEAPADRDQDGMPDVWEEKKGLNPDDPEDRNERPEGKGYTWLEIYLNGLAAPMRAE